jgi:2-polyprenyl-6-methoxyphenol hydroxylase-like FAD-dependent oxidoreductase
MTVEDAYVLSALLADVKEKKDVSAAPRAYAAVRRAWTHKFQTSSRRAGLSWLIENPDFRVDVDK